MPFVDWLQPGTPSWLQGVWGTRWRQAFGIQLDEWTARFKEGIKVRFPGLAPVDALPYIGAERGLPQAPGEDPAVYAERLRTAWDTWPRAGSPLGVLLALKVAGYPGFVLVQNKGFWYVLDGTTHVAVNLLNVDAVYGGPYFRFDSDNGTKWSRFIVLIPQSAIPSSWVNIQAVLSGATSPTVTEVNAIRRLVQQWKPAKATFLGIHVITSGLLYGWPVRTYGYGGTYGPSTSVVWGPDLE